MKKVGMAVLVAALALVWGLVQHPIPVGGQSCDVSLLTPCAMALMGAKPSKACCTELKKQEACFCQYMEEYSDLFTPATAQRLANACGITIPTCPPPSVA